ncbi:hypothetical protein PV516_18655 [Streptomyces scabiei]|uniref:hypothetical protein n=1 Tax=Streptomyces scabiei TaxID=1930 RepID=UPI0029A32EF1|nr:hypothetical protein [Streptomyces scabiei]MDX3165807.1 hypothetical protein [Streptomyces scabiei]
MAAIDAKAQAEAEKEARIAAIAETQDKGYGICWDCEVPREKHCMDCNGAWCPACDDW